MKQKIQQIVTAIKFLYPCIAFEESYSDSSKELVINAETYLNKIYPIVPSVKGMKFLGEDYWGRELFINEHEQYYCEVDGKLYFKGNDREGEPDYPVREEITYSYPSIDKELSEFNPCIEKVKKYILDNSDSMELLDVTTIFKESDNPKNSKIICNYKIKLKL